MRTVKTVGLLLLLSVPGLGIAQGWILYEDQEHSFIINFPREPDIRDFDYDSEYGATYPARTYFVEEGDSLHALTVIDFRDGEGKYEELPDKTDEATVAALWLYDQRGSIPHEAAKLRQRGGEILYDNWHHIDLVEGLQLVIANPDGSHTYAGLYLEKNRLYMLEATVPEGTPPQSLFQQSLGFTDESGNRIRYRLEPDGQRTRIR